MFLLLLSGVGIRAYRDLSRPEVWDYWKDQYFSPSLSSSLIANAGLGRGRKALTVSGHIGAAAANWFHDRLNEAHLSPGDIVLLSSPGGNVDQALIMGETIRSRGLITAVGIAEPSGRIRPSYCASACVLVFAGGKERHGVEGSGLGIHRFSNTTPVNDPVANTQRVAGMLLGYFTRMGVSSQIMEAMSQTAEIRWLRPKEAQAMNLITDVVGQRL